MAEIQTTLQFNVPIDLVRKYLTYRYETDPFKIASKEVKGYIPNYILNDESSKDIINFSAAAFDVVTKKTQSNFSWQWGYILKEIDKNITEVTIWYKWTILFGILGFGTTKHQAANELTESVLALEALSLGYASSANKDNSADAKSRATD